MQPIKVYEYGSRQNYLNLLLLAGRESEPKAKERAHIALVGYSVVV